VLRCRSLTRQCQSFIQPAALSGQDAQAEAARRRIIYRAIGFAHALRLQLRDQPESDAVQRWLTTGEWEALRRKPAGRRADALMLTMGQELGECVRRGEIDPCLAARVDTTLTEMLGAAASCERIRHTPMPFSYALLLHRTAYMYCFLLPFGLVDITGFMTPFVVAIVAYTFFGLDALGDELEEPFGMESNDLPLDTICRGIEISLLEALNDPDLPAPLQPVNFQLT
jgi:putative membrane protein